MLKKKAAKGEFLMVKFIRKPGTSKIHLPVVVVTLPQL